MRASMRAARVNLGLIFIFVLGAAFCVNAKDLLIKNQSSRLHKFKAETIFQSSDVIWGFDFLNADHLIFTERSGKLKQINLKTKKLIEFKGAPEVLARGQGGLLDIRVSPYEKNRIYMTYSEPKGKKSATALATAVVSGAELINVKKIFSAEPDVDSSVHFGSRIEFGDKKDIFITVGDRDERDLVQNLNTHLGKIIRLDLEGKAFEGNPFQKKKSIKPEIWSYGHRSPQGLAFDKSSKKLWMTEMGPRGGDELNLILPEKNYGWPDVTYGKEYSGFNIGPSTKEGVENPAAYWVPSISPSALYIYKGDLFSKWKNHFFIATLSGSHLRRLKIENDKVTEQEELLSDFNLRFRNVRADSLGHLYVSTDQGHLLKLLPLAE